MHNSTQYIRSLLPTCNIQQHLPHRYMYSNAVPAGLLFLAILVYFPSAPPLPPRWRMDLTFHFVCYTSLYSSLSSTVERLDILAGFKEVSSSFLPLLFITISISKVLWKCDKANYKSNKVLSLIGCEDQRILAHCHWLFSSTGCCHRLDRHDGSLLLCPFVDSVLCCSVFSWFD